MSIFDLQQAVVDDLNAEFSGLGAVKTNRPLIDLEAAIDQKVFVAKGMVGPSQLLSKVKSEDLLRIQVGVLKSAEIDDIDAQDVIIKVGEDIRKFYQARSINGAESSYKFHEVTSLAIYDYDKLDKDGSILAVVEITFKEWVTNGS